MNKFSVFRKNLRMIFLALSIITIASLIGFAFVFVSNVRKDAHKLRQREAESIVSAVEKELDTAADALQKLILKQEIINSVIVPEENDHRVEVVKALREAAAENTQMEELFLIASGSTYVCSSQYGIVEMDDFKYRQLVEEHRTRDIVEYSMGEESYISCDADENKMFLLCDFFYSDGGTLGLIGVKISAKIFGEARLRLIEYGGSVRIMNSRGYSVFGRNTEALTQKNASVIECSGDYGLEYTYLYRDQIWKKEYVLLSIFLFSSLLLILILDFYIARNMARKMYAPLGKIVDSIQTETTSENPQAEIDEYQLLNRVLEKNKVDYNEATSVLDQYRPKILETLCRRIIAGPVDADDVIRTLKSSKSRWTTDAEYYAVGLRFYLESGEMLGGLDFELIMEKLQTGLYRENEKQGAIAIRLENSFLVVGCFVTGSTQKQYQLIENEINGLAGEIIKPLHCNYVMTGIMPASPITDIRNTSRKILMELDRLLYYRNSKYMEDDVETAANVAPEERFKVDYFIRALEHEQTGEAIEFMRQYLSEEETAGNRERSEETLQYLYSRVIEYLWDHHCEQKTIDLLTETYHRAMETQDIRGFMETMYGILREHKGTSANATVKQIRKIIVENYMDCNLSLGFISDLMQMNPSYLSTLFAQEQGENFLDYLNRFRINKAKQLLDTTDILVRDVGYKVGFSSAQSFNRVFKRYEGSTPGQYKKSSTPPKCEEGQACK